ncbi:Gag-pol polyprotein [Pyrenophora tritici-repentis]|nr:Gag-pol polyprotein [Pyrenophora tritici-repentis]
MAPSTAMDAIPKLQADGSNAYHWEAALKLYANIHSIGGLLDGSYVVPYPETPHYQTEPTTTSSAFNTPQLLLDAQQRVRAHNKEVTTQYDKDCELYRIYNSRESSLTLAILNTVPRSVWDNVMNLPTVRQKYEAITARYREQGVTEECTIWADFFKLRAQDCPSTANFTDKFKAGLAKLDVIADCKLSNKARVYQFILAINNAYPDYGRDRRADLRRNVTLNVDRMCSELIDEARRDDPIKTINTTVRNNQLTSGGDNNRSQPLSDNNDANRSATRGRGNRGNGRAQRGRGRGSEGATQRPTNTSPYCKHCDCNHTGGGDNCWYTFPHLATEAWRQRQAQQQGKQQPTSTNAAAINAEGFAFTTVHLSEKVQSLTKETSNIKQRFIIDTGSSDHICNDRSKFQILHDTAPATINTGAGPITAKQVGTIQITVVTSEGVLNKVSFTNVLYAPDMFVSVLSHSKLRAKNLYYHGWDSKLYLMPSQQEIAFTPEIDKIPTLLLANTELEAARAFAFATAATTNPTGVLAPYREITLQELHELFGHADPKALKLLVANTTGLRLTTTQAFSCEACMLSKSKKQISRRSPARSTTFLHRIHIDIVGPVTPEGVNGERYWILYTDDYSRYRWIDFTDCKAAITSKLIQHLDKMETQHHVRVSIVHMDNDNMFLNQTTGRYFKDKGIISEPSTAYTPHQNGVAEASNYVVEVRARTMILAAPHISKSYWPYAAQYSIDVLNHSVSSAVPDSKTPRQLLFEHMKVANPVPNLCSFRTFGEAGYVHQPVQRRVQSAKFEPRSVKMYFVGREGSRIYLMWDPVTQSIHRTSSVAWPKHDVKAVVQEDTATTKPDQCFYIQDPPPALDPSSFPHHEVSLPEQGSGYVFDGLEAEAQSSFDFDADIDNYNSLTEVANARATPQHRDTSQNAPRHDEISASFDARNILDGRRRITRPPNRYAAVSRCFATAITEATTTDLSPEPATRKAARLHPYSKQWIAAEDEELVSLDQNGTWETTTTIPPDVYALPTKWVYKYKVKDDGQLERFKARLVVCGNRQETDFWRETYAAVARATTLKVLLALVATEDLECEQADVVTAFLNGKLDKDEVVYVRLPDGRKAKLIKALYGLRRSPRLWYNELSSYLKGIGLDPLESDPCVFKHLDGSLILAYVDDIIFITATKQRMKEIKEAGNPGPFCHLEKLVFDVKEAVYKKYKCRDLGPISHYLGLRIRRSRPSRLIEISMESYVDKLVEEYSRQHALPRYTPLDTSVLKLKLRSPTDLATQQQIQNYQKVIGKLLYPATQLRADISFHVAYLARAMSNPTQQHYEYAIQIIDYLKTFKSLVMSYRATSPHARMPITMYATSYDDNKNNTNPTLHLHGYSDASFADGEDRKSTSGYLFKLAGGTICHKSVKQKLVTTSTTEAEYVALTYAAKEATWLYRLLHQLGYNGTDTHPILIYGDNAPSIQLLHSEGHHERTKHVDIYYHYIKDQVRDGNLYVEHVRTHEMAADGLTKPLERQAHSRYLQQLGLTTPTIETKDYNKGG